MRLILKRRRIAQLFAATWVFAYGALGCREAEPSDDPAFQSIQGVRRAVIHDGVRREYLLFKPNLEPTGSSPLLIALHGGGGSGAQMADLTGFHTAATDWIVVYPDGINRVWNDGRPNIGSDSDDAGFILTLIDELDSRLALDRSRIFLVGFSNGGHLTLRLALTHPHRFAAVAVAGALLSETLANDPDVLPPPPALVIAGDADPITPFAGGEVGGLFFDHGRVLSAAQTIAFLALIGDLAPVPGTFDPEPVSSNPAIVQSDYFRQDDPARVLLRYIRVIGGGHTWPGGPQYLPAVWVGPVRREISATGEILRFFTGSTSRAGA